MAEINTSDNRKTKKIFVKKRTNVDLTPMVDLGFLLITFFVFTTTMTKATAMNMIVPNDRDTSTSPVCESCAITVLLAEKNRLYYYEGMDESAVYKETSYSADGIRKLIVDKKAALSRSDPRFTLQLIIKPSGNSTFKNLVDIIDEANICALKRYYITALNSADEEKLR